MKDKIAGLKYDIMLLPGMAFLFVFSIVPMFGIVIAFQNFKPARGILHSEWVGLDNFKYMFQIPDSRQVFLNTLIIAVLKIIGNLVVPVIFALILNEIRGALFKKSVQTIVYLPHFLSWVILASVFGNILSLDGVVNQFVKLIGFQPIMFLASNTWFRPIMVITDVWKEFGFGAVIYLAAIVGINPALYESAVIDGATRFKQVIYITLPGITPTIVLLTALSLGNILNAGFDQIFNLYNPLVYQTGDIIDTYVYRTGIMNAQYGLATAVGTLKSVISFALILTCNKLAEKYANYRIF